ncbi:hypothetical protein DBT_0231 [Dissulfuribacter thermophilus]|uniref:Peptidase A2 domain-containing protein n=2 Tax=Dissulfuribacter thermophilus TaxID=1156395 RepID=A0A1B9F971_9BACT|nr:hypothetical protein DBT_0231 [Dissulfuribacter thermophilus]
MRNAGISKLSFVILTLITSLFIPFLKAYGVTCSTENGLLFVSPSEIVFYISIEDSKDPTPVTLNIDGQLFSGNGTTTTLCWTAVSSTDWIEFQGLDSRIVSGQGQGGSLQVTVDISKLPFDQMAYLGGTSTSYEGNITISSNLVKTEALGGTGIIEERTIPVKVYVNSLRIVKEENLSTSQSLSLPIYIPVSKNIRGALYVLLEHTRLLPDQVLAYRVDSNNEARYDLFSDRGHLTDEAGDLFFAPDIQNVPVMVPYSLDDTFPPMPYQSFNLPSADANSSLSNVKGYIPVNIGEGLKLKGLEGDLIVRALVGDPKNIKNWRLWKELLYEVVHISPITGTWVVTEEFNGKNYSYIKEDGTAYPLVLTEGNGSLEGRWLMPDTTIHLSVQYLDRPQGGYEIYFQEPSNLFGLVEYLYTIETIEGSGYIEGTWQYRIVGDSNWSIPQKFSAIRQEVVIPLNKDCNCYLVDGKVNGYPIQFIVDTGASTVLLSSADAQNMGVDLSDTSRCVPGSVTGVGGQVSAVFCMVDIELGGWLLKRNVWAGFSDTWSGPGLLGMTFLDTIHVSKGSDGTLILAP